MRKMLLSLVVLLTVLGASATLVTTFDQPSLVRASDDDCDSSGSGSGDCDDDDRKDDHDDNSGHGGGDHHDDELDEDDVAAQTALAQPIGEREIRFVDERVTPNTITIQAGETVTFVNADDDEHTATGPGFDTGEMNPGDSVTITFDTPGTFDFVCQFHPEMRGTVIVEGDATPVASPVAASSPAAAATGATIEISIVDFAFEQAEITVAPGTTITWTNDGVAPHTVSGLPEESGTLEPGQSFSFTFDEAGTFGYQCAFHPQMVGQVLVDPNAPPAGS